MINSILDNMTDRYYEDTSPMEFIKDLQDIMKDGDNLAPEKLISDIVFMLNHYIEAQEVS